MRMFSPVMVYHLADSQNRCADEASKHITVDGSVKVKVLDLTDQEALSEELRQGKASSVGGLNG